MLRGSEQHQERVLLTISGCVLLCIALVVYLGVAKPFSRWTDDPDAFVSVVINTPYVGQGVEKGTPVVLHGVSVGQVTAVSSTASGGVRLDTELQAQPTRGLTDAMSIDFRPINYFGVPGVNVTPNAGGRVLHDGADLSLMPTGNFTLSELLNQMGSVSASSLTPQLISVIDRATRYADGLNPAVESAVTMARAVDAVQTVPTDVLLTNLATAVAAFPPFADSVLTVGTRLIKFDYYPGQVIDESAAASVPRLQSPYLQAARVPDLGDFSEDYYQKQFLVTLDVVQNGLFGAVGKLLSSHVDDLTPLILGITAITDTGPVLLRPQDVAQKLAELRTRFERLYAGNGEQRAVSVRILLDSLPGVAAPLGVTTEATP
ncbi:MAG: mammalian cell entry protein [Mycobacterium kyogaense]|uniref:MlaD family protein n=1 Tax=Mycobacterium kyogaense TaxID=2212479 RepID=UPI002FF4B7C4